MEKLWLALRPALVTFVVTFVGLFGPTLLGWTQDLIDALSAGNFTVPDVSALGQAALSALGAAAAGLVNFVFRYGQQLLGRGKTVIYIATGEPLPPPKATTRL